MNTYEQVPHFSKIFYEILYVHLLNISYFTMPIFVN